MVAQTDTTHVQQRTPKCKNLKPNSNYTQQYDPASIHYGLTELNAVLPCTLVSQKQ